MRVRTSSRAWTGTARAGPLAGSGFSASSGDMERDVTSSGRDVRDRRSGGQANSTDPRPPCLEIPKNLAPMRVFEGTHARFADPVERLEAALPCSYVLGFPTAHPERCSCD